jgi:putative ABC transport system substrate-binding protein
MTANCCRRGGGLLAAALAAALLALPASGWGKSLGIIYPETCVVYDAATEALKSHLAANGFGPSALEIYVQRPSADPMSWANALRKFAAVDTDLIVVFGDSLLQVACREKIKSPVGYGFVLEPGLCSCARSASNPGGNASGASAKTPLATLLAKARMMTDYTTVGVLDLPGDAVTKAQIEELRSREKEFGFTVTPIPVARREEAVAALRAAPPVGLFLLPGCSLVAGQTEELLAVANSRKIATLSLQPPRGASAALLALYPSPEEQGRLVGEVAVQILTKGPAAAPTAPLTPKKIELEVNVPLARQLGMKLPMALLESATRVIK